MAVAQDLHLLRTAPATGTSSVNMDKAEATSPALAVGLA